MINFNLKLLSKVYSSGLWFIIIFYYLMSIILVKISLINSKLGYTIIFKILIFSYTYCLQSKKS